MIIFWYVVWILVVIAYGIWYVLRAAKPVSVEHPPETLKIKWLYIPYLVKKDIRSFMNCHDCIKQYREFDKSILYFGRRKHEFYLQKLSKVYPHVPYDELSYMIFEVLHELDKASKKSSSHIPDPIVYAKPKRFK